MTEEESLWLNAMHTLETCPAKFLYRSGELVPATGTLGAVEGGGRWVMGEPCPALPSSSPSPSYFSEGPPTAGHGGASPHRLPTTSLLLRAAPFELLIRQTGFAALKVRLLIYRPLD
jgi:hypothetical protein